MISDILAKKIRQIPTETNRPDIQEKLDSYVTEICSVEANRFHFFMKALSSLLSGNREVGP